MCIIYTTVYYGRGSDLCATIVQFHCTYIFNTILYYVLVLICVKSICIIFMLWHKQSAPFQHRHNWFQSPLTSARCPSRANGGDPVPAPANVGPSITPQSHSFTIRSVRPIHPVASKFPHTSQHIKSQFLWANPIGLIPIQFNQYDPDNTIQTTHPIRSIVSSEGKPPTRTSLIRKTHPQLLHLPQNLDFILHLLMIPPHLIFHPPQRPLPPEICSIPLLMNLLLPSLIRIEIAPSQRPIFWPF